MEKVIPWYVLFSTRECLIAGCSVLASNAKGAIDRVKRLGLVPEETMQLLAAAVKPVHIGKIMMDRIYSRDELDLIFSDDETLNRRKETHQ